MSRKYEAQIYRSSDGELLERFEFDGDSAALAADHVEHMSRHPAMVANFGVPSGEEGVIPWRRLGNTRWKVQRTVSAK